MQLVPNLNQTRPNSVSAEEVNQNQQRMRNFMGGLAVLLATAAFPQSTTPQASDVPPDRSQYIQPEVKDPCFGAAFTEWSDWSGCDPIYNCDSEMDPNNPKKCPKKSRARQIAWPENHPPNPNCNPPLIEYDESQCNCDKCIFRYGEWIRAPECHGGGHKCHLKFTRHCQLQNKDFYVINQYKGIGLV